MLLKGLPGRRVDFIDRRGKYLLFYLHDSTVVIHLRMTGRLLLFREIPALDKHSHVIFNFDKPCPPYFHDIRKFGTIYWLRKGWTSSKVCPHWDRSRSRRSLIQIIFIKRQKKDAGRLKGCCLTKVLLQDWAIYTAMRHCSLAE